MLLSECKVGMRVRWDRPPHSIYLPELESGALGTVCKIDEDGDGVDIKWDDSRLRMPQHHSDGMGSLPWVVPIDSGIPSYDIFEVLLDE
jgi:hypothetical protein